MENTFDYVVVGAGSSGCVMANRLSEDGTKTVLILEAGGKDTNMFIHMPSGYSQLFLPRMIIIMVLKLNQKLQLIAGLYTGQEEKVGEAHLQ